MKRVLALFLVVAAAGACSRTPVPGSGELRIVPLGGEVRLIDGGESSLLDEAMTVDNGIQLETGLAGHARIEFPQGSSVELAPEARISLTDQVPDVRGRALVRTNGADVRINAGAAQIEASDSTFRIDTTLGVLLAVYSGEAAILGAGVVVPFLSQSSVYSNGDASAPEPIQVHPNDPWDVRLLGQAIDLGRRLLSLEKGLDRQLPAGNEREAIEDALEPGFPRPLIQGAMAELRNAAQVVVAAAVASAVRQLDGGSLRQLFADVVNLGARWIVVVARWGLEKAADALLDELGELTVTIARAGELPPAPSPVSASTSVTPRTGGPDGTREVDTDGNNPGDPKSNGDPTTTEPEPPQPPPEEPPEDGGPQTTCSNQVECAVGDILPGGPDVPGIRSI